MEEEDSGLQCRLLPVSSRGDKGLLKTVDPVNKINVLEVISTVLSRDAAAVLEGGHLEALPQPLHFPLLEEVVLVVLDDDTL